MGTFDRPDWGLVQTLLWIRDRDPAKTGLNTLGRLITKIDPGRIPGARNSMWFKARESREELLTRLRIEATLHKALLASRIIAWGLENAAGERREINPMLWHDLAFRYRSSWGAYAGPKSHRREVAPWTHLRFPREKILLLWPIPTQIGDRETSALDAAGNIGQTEAEVGKQSETRQTIAAESKCKDWLESKMKSGPQAKPKACYRDDARANFNVGIRAFDRAWRNAILHSDTNEWGKPGPKSRHRSKTPK